MTILSKISEHEVQRDFVTEIGYRYASREDFIPILFYAVVNGFWVGIEENGTANSRRKDGLIKKYLEEGLKSGVADFHYDQPRGRFSKMVIEFKIEGKRNKQTRDKILTGGLSPEQIQYLTAMKPYAYVRVCYTTEEAVKEFDQYMALPLLFGVKEKWSVEEILTGKDT